MASMQYPIVDLEATGTRISELRKAKGLSVKDICDITGVTVQAVYHWQYGKKLPSIDNLVILASIFEVTMDEIVVTR